MKKFGIKQIAHKIRKVIFPLPAVGGLEVSDSTIRYTYLHTDGRLDKASLRIPTGTIEKGELKDKKVFTRALSELFKQVGGAKNKNVHVVLSIPPEKVYTQIFSIPLLPDDKVPEAAELNLQMISPIDKEGSYSDYQVLGENVPGTELELLGAFSESAIIDQYTEALKSVGFVPVAIEFPALSISRLIEKNMVLEKERSYLVIHATNDGISTMIVKNGHLYFDHFNYWSAIESGGGFRSFLAKEVKRVGSFYMNQCRCVLNDAIIISSALHDEIGKIIQKGFPDMKIHTLELAGRKDFEANWSVSTGAAFRGMLRRFRDHEMTLSSVGSEEGYFQSFLLNFISSWRSVWAIALMVFMLAFFVADMALARFSFSLSKQVAALHTQVDIEQFEKLQVDAVAFNRSVELALAADEQTIKWSPLFIFFEDLAVGEDVLIDKIALDDSGRSIVVGRAEDEKSILEFKNRIENHELFENVNLPLTKIQLQFDEKFSFSMTFDLISTDFSVPALPEA